MKLASGTEVDPRSDFHAGDSGPSPEVENIHIPVLFQAVLESLKVRPGERYVDATVGAGGHAAGILAASSPDGRLLGLDRDAEATEVARARLATYSDRVLIDHASFVILAKKAREHEWVPADGILFDLGLSSLQLANPARGFAFMANGPLDMRFDPTASGPTAGDLVNCLSIDELESILYQFGEERQTRRIARAIVAARPLHTTRELVDVIVLAVGRRGRLHPATRTFQALRIAVNEELAALETALPQAVDILPPGGRLVVISFHSLEDRLVKRFMRRESRDCLCSSDAPVCICGHKATLRLAARKPLRPTVEQVEANPRCRSARLRAAVRI